MLKRKISLLIAVLMLFSMLTGCSTNELGYLNLSGEINNLTQYGFKSSTQVEVSKMMTGGEKNSKIDLEVSGDANIEDLNAMYLNMDIKVKVDGKGNAEPVKLIIADNKIYVSKNVITEALRLQEEFGENEYSPMVVEKLLQELKDTNYIVISEMDDVYGSFSYKEDYKVLTESAKEYLKNAFKGFDSKLITKTSNGYTVELTAESAVEFAERLVKYISENKKLVFDETMKYLEKVYAAIEIEGMDGSVEAGEVMAEFEGMRESFYAAIDEAAAYFETGEQKEIVEALDRSYIRNELYKKGSVYGQNIEGELVFDGVIAGNIKSKTEMTAKTVKISSVEGRTITAEELEDLYNVLENKYNPVETIEVSWYSWYEQGDEADVSKYRADGKYDWDYQSYVIIEDRVYLPLRYIGETFGEDVQWDNEGRKAYVVRESEKIDMTGVLVDGKTMVKVRDFEKLGYKIDFVQDEDWSMATIEKNK